MKIVKRPIPIDREIPLNPYKTIMSKTDAKGIIEYANDYFMEISKYKEWELMAQPHNVIRHPDMPKIMFKVLWDRLFEGENIHAIVKNLAKDGSYYWVVTDFKTTFDENGNVIAHYSRRKAVPEHVKTHFAELYKKLLEIEATGGMEASGSYLSGLLEDSGMSYDEYLLNIFGLSEKDLMSYMTAEIDDNQLYGHSYSAEDAIHKTKKKKGFLSRFFV